MTTTPTLTPAQSAAEAAARRARQQATVVASLAAVVPTVLAAQGMASLAMDVLGFPVLVAVALAGFLELALISSALLARASALSGRPGGADAAAVWAVSIVSGTLAGAHEFVGPEVDGIRSWENDPASLLAAGVRIAAPLVAAWLWERVLTAARREHAVRTLVEIRRDRRMLAVARAALAVRRIEVAQATEQVDRRGAARLRRARRRLDRAHLATLRTVPPGANLPTVLAAVGAVDILPAATLVRELDVPPALERALLELRADDWRPEPVAEPAPLPATEPDEPAALTVDPAPADDPHQTDPSRPDAVDAPELPHSSHAGQTDGPDEPTSVDQPVVVAAEAAVRNATVVSLSTQGLSQRAIAAKLGMSKSTVARVIARDSTNVDPSPRPDAERHAFDGDGPLTSTGPFGPIDHVPVRTTDS